MTISNNQEVSTPADMNFKSNAQVVISNNTLLSVKRMEMGGTTVPESNDSITVDSNTTFNAEVVRGKFAEGYTAITNNGGSLGLVEFKNNQPNDITISGNNQITNGLRLRFNGNITVSNNNSIDGGNWGIEFKDCDDAVVNGNTVHSIMRVQHNGSLTISNNTFYDGMEIKDHSKALTISGNKVMSSSSQKAGISAKDNTNVTVSDNIITSNANYGMRMKQVAADTSFVITGNTFSNNGKCGMKTENVSSLIINNNIFSNNGTNGTQDDDSNGLKFQDSHIEEFKGNTIKNNYWAGVGIDGASGMIGGAVGEENYVYGNGSIRLTEGSGGNAGISIKNCIGDLTVAGNYVYNNASDGVGIRDSSYQVVIGTPTQRNYIYSNGRSGIGLMVSNTSSNPKIQYNTIYNNKRGIGLNGSSNPDIVDNYIYSNKLDAGYPSTTGYGIGVNDSASPIVQRNYIYGNEKAGIGFDKNTGSNTPLVKNNMIYGNTSTGNAYGIELTRISGGLNLYFNTIAYNKSAGVYRDGSSTPFDTVTIGDSILWGNNDDISNFTPTVSYSDIQESGWGGNNNISSDPEFDGGQTGYHILEVSPCKDAGTNLGIYDDIDRGTRPYASGYDMGADEYGAAAPIAPIISSVANQAFTVGDSSTPMSKITLWEHDSTPTVTATNNIRVRIPIILPKNWTSG